MRTKDVITTIINMLPKEPRSYDTVNDPGFWTDGKQILCPSMAECEIVIQFLLDVFSEHSEIPTIQIGYYDPYEDAQNKETDDYTGFYCIQFE